MDNSVLKPTVLLDFEGRFLGLIDDDGNQIDAFVVVTTDDDDDVGEAVVTTEDDDLAVSAAAVPRPSFEGSRAGVVRAESLYVNSLFDPDFVGYSRNVSAEGLFSEDDSDSYDEDDVVEYMSDGDLEYADRLDSDWHVQENVAEYNGHDYDAILAEVKYGLPSILKKKKKTNGKTTVTFLFFSGNKSETRNFWVLRAGDKKNVWDLPSVQIAKLPSIETSLDDAYKKAMYAFMEQNGMDTAPSLDGPDAYAMRKISSTHVLAVVRIDDEDQFSSPDVAQSVADKSAWVSWKDNSKNALRRMRIKNNRPQFTWKTRKLLRTLKAMNLITEDRIRVKSTELFDYGIFGSASAFNAKESDFEVADSTVSDHEYFGNFSYIDIASGELRCFEAGAAARLFSDGPYADEDSEEEEEEELVFSGNRHNRRSRSRPRSVSPFRRRKSAPLRNFRSRPRRTRPRPNIRRGRRRLGFGRFLRNPLPGARRTGYGRGFYNNRRIRLYIPYLPGPLIGYRRFFFPRTYVYPTGIAPRLPLLPEFHDVLGISRGASLRNVDPQLILAAVEDLRRRYLGYPETRGYDIVPNFYTNRFEWVKIAPSY